MKYGKRTNLKKKILEKYSQIKSFCKDIGYLPLVVSDIITGRIRGSDDFWEKAKNKLDVSKEELENLKVRDKLGNQGISRTRLKEKIKESFGTIDNFCKKTDLKKPVVYGLCVCRRNGSLDTWIKIQNALDIPDKEMWGIIKHQEAKHAK